jgi:16S rRNA processing protein RimM
VAEIGTGLHEGGLANVTTNASWVVLARVVRPQGRRGELLAEILTDFPNSFAQRKQLFLRSEGGEAGADVRPVVLEAFWHHKGRVVLKFTGIDSIGDAEPFRGFEVVVPLSERMPLTEDAVYVSDLVGARVMDVSRVPAEDVGEIVDVVPEGPGPAMLVLNTGAREPGLVPFVKAYLQRIDLAAKRLEMLLPEGLLAIDAPLTVEERQQMDEEKKTGN